MDGNGDINMNLFRLQNKNGLTLAELTVATILMGIIMLGVVSLDFTIRSIDKTTKSGALTTMRASTAMMRISKDLEKAVGDGANQGIFGASSGSNTLCFRHDTNDPNSYNDDTWSCYIVALGETTMYRCPLTIEMLAAIQMGDPVSCVDAPQPIYTIVSLSNPNFFNIDPNLDYIEVTLQTRADVASPAHPLDNPQYEITTRVTPPGHSF